MTSLEQPNAPAAETALDVRALNRRTEGLVAAMAALFDQGQAPHHHSFPEHFGPGDNGAAIASYLQGFLRPRNPFRARTGFAKGLFLNDELAGYLLYRLNKTDDVFYGKVRWSCHIEDIVVDEAARGRKGASAMMSALLEELAPLGECAISGNVWNGNSASQALFESHGFEPLSQSYHKVNL